MLHNSAPVVYRPANQPAPASATGHAPQQHAAGARAPQLYAAHDGPPGQEGPGVRRHPSAPHGPLQHLPLLQQQQQQQQATAQSRNPQSLPSPTLGDPNKDMVQSLAGMAYNPYQKQPAPPLAHALPVKQVQSAPQGQVYVSKLPAQPSPAPSAPGPVVYNPAPGLAYQQQSPPPYQYTPQPQHQHQQHQTYHPQQQQQYQQHTAPHVVRPPPLQQQQQLHLQPQPQPQPSPTAVYAPTTQHFRPSPMQVPVTQVRPPATQAPVYAHVAPMPMYVQSAAPAVPALITNYKCNQCGAPLASANTPCRRIHRASSRFSAAYISAMTGPTYGSHGTHTTMNGNVMTTTTVGPPMLVSGNGGAVMYATQPSRPMLVSPPPLQPHIVIPQQQQQQQTVVVTQLNSPPPTPNNNHGTDQTYYGPAQNLYGGILAQNYAHQHQHHGSHVHITHHLQHLGGDSGGGGGDQFSIDVTLQQQQDSSGGDQQDWNSLGGLDNGSGYVDYADIGGGGGDLGDGFGGGDLGGLDIGSLGM